MDIIKSFARCTAASLVAKNGTNKLFQLFEELQVRNSESKLITLKHINGTYFDTNLNRFDLKKFPMAAILDFKCSYLSCLKSYRPDIWNFC